MPMFVSIVLLLFQYTWAVQIYLRDWYVSKYVSFWYISRNGSAVLHDNSIFNFLRNFNTISRSGCTNWHFHQECICFPFSVSLPTLISCLVVKYHTNRFKWYLIMALICMSLMVSDVEHLFLYLLTIWMSSLGKYLFRSSAHFINWIVSLLLSCVYTLYILDIKVLPNTWFTSIF